MIVQIFISSDPYYLNSKFLLEETMHESYTETELINSFVDTLVDIGESTELNSLSAMHSTFIYLTSLNCYLL